MHVIVDFEEPESIELVNRLKKSGTPFVIKVNILFKLKIGLQYNILIKYRDIKDGQIFRTVG